MGTGVRSRGRVSSKDIMLFARQAHVMISAGIPLQRALMTYELTAAETPLGEVLSEVSAKVQEGHLVSAAMEQYPKVFPRVFVGLIQTGEKTGQIGPALDRLAGLTEKTEELKQRFSSALIYPAFLIAASTTGLALLLFFLLPMLEPVIMRPGAEVPLPTLLLFGFSHLMASPRFWIAAAWAVVIPLLLSHQLWRSPSRRAKIIHWWHRTVLKLPLLGPLVMKTLATHFMFMVATILESGVAAEPALAQARDSTGNREMEARIEKARELLMEGDDFYGCLRQARVVPRAALELIRAGEEAARVPDMLYRAALIYDAEVENALEVAVSLLEPIFLCFLGIVVGTVFVATAMPILNMVNGL